MSEQNQTQTAAEAALEKPAAKKKRAPVRGRKSQAALLQWYIVTCSNGKEDTVIANLKNTVKAMHFEESVVDVKAIKRRELTTEDFDDRNPQKLPPARMHNSKHVKWMTVGAGKYRKAQIVDRNKFPGYIYVRMVMSDDTWYAVRNAPNISGLVGSSGRGAKPIPITDAEERLLAGECEDPNLRVLVTDNAIVEMDREAFDEQGNPYGFDGAAPAPASEKPPVGAEASFEEAVIAPAARGALSEGSKLMPAALDTPRAAPVAPEGAPEFRVGHAVVIDAGDYAGISGTVREVNDAAGRLTVEINLLGKTLLIPVAFAGVKLAQ